MIKTYRAGRILLMGTVYRQPGELVPEAHTWFRLDDSLHTGYLKEAEVTEAEFRDAVDEFCPTMADQIFWRVNLPLVPEPPAPEPEPPTPPSCACSNCNPAAPVAKIKKAKGANPGLISLRAGS